MTRMGAAMAVVAILCVIAVSGGACTRKEAPELQPAAPPPPPPPPPPAPPVVRDAASDVGDAAADAPVDAHRGGGKRSASPPAAGGGGGGITVEGSLAHGGGDKVVREAQGKLRACVGPGRKGRVSFNMTVDDRGHVTVVNIPTSTLPGGSEVETCMVHVLRDLRFPRSGGESTLSFQMSFAR